MPACIQCGMERDGGPEGLCPACLMRGLYATAEPETETATKIGGYTGDSFGPYRTLYPLGEGGMGTVYLATQEEPIRRRVALKVIKHGMDSKDVLARFRRERQALAMMEHSSIARIYDAGTSALGRPYFVMEYVDGTPITRYCDQHRLPVSKRLGLFLAVCKAVQHAHQKGIIHRDIKPSNILVTEEDGQPVPKIIDFGIAKPAAAGMHDDTLYTQFGQMVGTPQYASPEQADVVGGEVGAASDIYSLGVLLYELLVGTVPFDAAALKQAGLAEMLRMIREEDPPSLSSKLTGPGTDSGVIAEMRDTNPAALRKLVERDLDWIAHKALEKTPSRRYLSADAFASDISRFLLNKPVEAAPPSLLYKASKIIRRNRPAVAAVASAMLVAAPLIWLINRPRTPKLTAKDSIVVTDFANTTGDSVFDDTLREGLISQLAQSPYLFIQPDNKINSILRQMEKPAGSRLTPELGREVCERTGSTAVAEGSIAALGTEYVLGLRLRNCQTGELLDSEQTQAGRKEEVLNALSRIAKSFRSRVGESLATVELHSKPLEATTNSLEALKAYSEGRRAHIAGNADAAQLFARAIELDPQFAMAYAMLGQSLTVRDEFKLSDLNLTKAYELRNRVTDPERLYITALYELWAMGNFEKARQALELWAQTYTREAMPHGLLSGTTNGIFARYDAAIEHGMKAMELDPAMSFAYFNVSRSYARLGNLSDSAKILDKALKKGINSQEIVLQRYSLGFLHNDQAEMQAAVEAARGRSDAETLLAIHLAMAQASKGRFESARGLMENAQTSSLRAGYRERAAQALGVEAVWHGLFGNAAAARSAADQALGILRGREVNYLAGLARSMAGDAKGAQTLTEELARAYPEDTYVQLGYLPVVEAQLALNTKDPAKALELLGKTEPIQMGTSRGFIGAMYPFYFRGQALLALGRAKDAAAEFQKILDHPGQVVVDPIAAAARLQLARAWRADGDRVKAKAEYQKFLDLWKDADAGLQALVQARQEASSLL